MNGGPELMQTYTKFLMGMGSDYIKLPSCERLSLMFSQVGNRSNCSNRINYSNKLIGNCRHKYVIKFNGTIGIWSECQRQNANV